MLAGTDTAGVVAVGSRPLELACDVIGINQLHKDYSHRAADSLEVEAELEES